MPPEETVLICFRGACQAAAHPCGYNRITHGLYCVKCAMLIDNFQTNRGEESFFPLLIHANTNLDGGQYQSGIILIRVQYHAPESPTG